MENEPLLTNKEVMDFLQVDSKTLKLYRDKYDLPYFKINERTFRYQKNQIMDWLQKRTHV